MTEEKSTLGPILYAHREQIGHFFKGAWQAAQHTPMAAQVKGDLFLAKWIGIGLLDDAARLTDFIHNHVDLYEGPGGKLMDIGFHFIQTFGG